MRVRKLPLSGARFFIPMESPPQRLKLLLIYLPISVTIYYTTTIKSSQYQMYALLSFAYNRVQTIGGIIVFKETFSKRLKELREKENLSQTALAEKLKVSRGAISFYENGDRTPDIEFLERVCKYFNIDAGYLLGTTNAAATENIEIGKSLGLSDQAIKVLKFYNSLNFPIPSPIIPLVNLLIEQATPAPTPESYHIVDIDGTTNEVEENRYLSDTKDWESKQYIDVLSSIERYLSIHANEELSIGITKDGKPIEMTADKLYIRYGTVEKFSAKDLIDAACLKEIERKLDQLKEIKPIDTFYSKRGF